MRTPTVVALGAALGATLRWSVGELLAVDGFPWATLVVNVVGCVAVGVAAVHLDRRGDVWYFAVTGVLGGLTTASAFAVETRGLLDDGRPLAAAAYVAASFAGGLAAVSVARAMSVSLADRRAGP